ncbi:MAG: hypothetical protein KA712_19625 [Myxococcales bacterium]|nr:hypothetical protein [Myxococcales bacterium]
MASCSRPRPPTFCPGLTAPALAAWLLLSACAGASSDPADDADGAAAGAGSGGAAGAESGGVAGARGGAGGVPRAGGAGGTSPGAGGQAGAGANAPVRAPQGLMARPANPTCTAPDSEAAAPAKLSETGCFQPGDPRKPAAGLIPYGVTAALWSDGADKRRWMALPDGAQIEVDPATGDFSFPNGTVLLKAFEMDGMPLETRFLVRLATGTWVAYTYVFNEAGTDATLLGRESDYRFLERAGGTLEWTFPSRENCFACHTEGAGRSIGLELAQLDGDFVYPGDKLSNQVDTLIAIGVLPSGVDRTQGFPALDDPQASLDRRARAYLHANCAHCHRPGQTKDVSLDLRYASPLANTNACGVAPAKNKYGIDEIKLIDPGAPENSMVSFRMRSTVKNIRMPDLGTRVVDERALMLVDDWISSLQSCAATPQP